MRSKSFSFVLLASVTSAEQAAAIEGDLLEERAVNGTRWFVLHVIRTAFALFGLALTQAPLRTIALSVAAVSASCLMCPIVDHMFFEREAWLPTPLLGFAAVIGFAVLVGAALVKFAGALGVRAAAAAAGLLILMFTVAQMSGSFEQWPAGAADDVGLLRELGMFAVNLGVGLCVYIGPLLIASAVSHARQL
jgi:hypothetical protein